MNSEDLRIVKAIADFACDSARDYHLHKLSGGFAQSMDLGEALDEGIWATGDEARTDEYLVVSNEFGQPVAVCYDGQVFVPLSVVTFAPYRADQTRYNHAQSTTRPAAADE